MKVTQLCDHSEVKISFAVFESFKKLSETPVREWRELRLLKEEKSNFVASFTETGIAQILNDQEQQ